MDVSVAVAVIDSAVFWKWMTVALGLVVIAVLIAAQRLESRLVELQTQLLEPSASCPKCEVLHSLPAPVHTELSTEL